LGVPDLIRHDAHRDHSAARKVAVFETIQDRWPERVPSPLFGSPEPTSSPSSQPTWCRVHGVPPGPEPGRTGTPSRCPSWGRAGTPDDPGCGNRGVLLDRRLRSVELLQDERPSLRNGLVRTLSDGKRAERRRTCSSRPGRLAGLARNGPGPGSARHPDGPTTPPKICGGTD
jgi:hypothetical protein